MAGIGFELKKLFAKKGLFAIIRAYGYASIVCIGPTILGIILLLGVRLIAEYGGADGHTADLLNAMITYTLFSSLLISNMFAMIITSFTADALFQEKDELIMPSYHGSISIMLVIGCILYGIFLWNAGIPYSYQLLCLILFGELVIVWTQINYLTAVKDYKGILLTFFIALLASLATGYIMIHFHFPTITSLLLSVTIGYGVMMLWYYLLLLRYFPEGKGSALFFLKWIDRYPPLAFLGFFMVLGLSLHLILMWFSPVGIQIQGLFYGAPSYDIPSMFAFLSILVTTVNFVTSVEVNFYPKYRNYFSLFNAGGSLVDLIQAETEMKVTMQKELGYTFTKQLFSTIVFIVAGTIFLPKFPLNFSEEMLGIFRVLCVGYAFYAIGNSIMLLSLYFCDNYGALYSGFLFALTSSIATLLLRPGSIKYYGFGFLIGGAIYTISALVRLSFYINNLSYHVLSSQPIVYEERKTVFSKISDLSERRYQRKYGKNKNAMET